MLTTKQLSDMTGTPVRFAHWHGVLQDIFVSPFTGKVLVKIYFAKNVFKRQAAEIAPLSEQLVASTWKDLYEQVAHYEAQQAVALAGLGDAQ